MMRKNFSPNQNPNRDFLDDRQSRNPSAWPQPFADVYGGQLTAKLWLLTIIGFVFLHLLALQIAQFVGCFQSSPNLDHLPGMQEVLKQGYPISMHVPPGFSYYLAFKWIVTQALGLPYWSGKYFFDIFPIVLSGILTTSLTQLLTRNRFIAITSGFSLVCAPIYILGIAMEDKGFFFHPFFITSLLLLVRELQRERGPRIWYFAISGMFMGTASLIRGNSQVIFVAIAPFVLWILHRFSIPQWQIRAVVVLSIFLSAQILVILPWSLMQRNVGGDGIMVSGGVYRGYFWSVKRQTGNKISDWLGGHYEEPQRTFKGVVDFNLRWLKEDPAALFELYLLKAIRAWYISESGRWDKFLLITHLPFWIFALLGVWRWWRRAPADPACIFTLMVILYMWAVSAIAGGIARHTNFIYGFIGILDGVFFLTCIRKV